MAELNQVLKTDGKPIKIDYTSKDYSSILADLIASVPGISQRWSTTDENDPGMILVKLMATLGDMLFYTQDQMSLEVYPNSVTLRKNAAAIYNLIGYKMRWYKSAIISANVVNTYSNAATIPRFCTFTTETNDIIYTTFNSYDLPANTNNNGLVTLIELIQGIPVVPSRVSSSPYPEEGKPWHSIYGFNYTTDELINNRLYFPDKNIDQDHIIVVDDKNEEWILRDNIYLTQDVGKFFEFGVDINDVPYIEFVDYIGNYGISKFKVFYIKSKGEDGQLYANALKYITGSVWSRISAVDTQNVYNVSDFIYLTHGASTYGYNPETPDEARKNSKLYQNTLDTLITLADFERATLREPGVANVRATDLTNDPGISTSYVLGDINRDGIIDENDYNLLRDYLADPAENPLSSLQLRLANLSQDGDAVSNTDLQLFYNYLNPVFYSVGNITMKDESITSEPVTQADLTKLQQYLRSPSTSTLTEFQKRLCDMNQDGEINIVDETLMKFWLKQYLPNGFPKLLDEYDQEWSCGNINMNKTMSGKDIINSDDVEILKQYVKNPERSALSDFQKRLCDVNQDGIVNQTDIDLLDFYVKTNGLTELPKISDVSDEKIGRCGKQNVVSTDTLDGFVVKLYILRTEAYESWTDEDYSSMIKDDLEDYKILPLTIDVDLHSIQKYYWTITGKFYTKEPISRDDLQTIIVNINNQIKYDYDVTRINFNTAINYRDIIDTILSIDKRILMVNLDPIKYYDVEGNEVSQQQLTGDYSEEVEVLDGKTEYNITLPNVPILPGSLMIRVNGGQYTLNDNNNGEIYNPDNVLAKKGKINYLTGEIELKFTAVPTENLVIDYVKNQTNVAVYRNLSTQKFFFDQSSLLKDDVISSD